MHCFLMGSGIRIIRPQRTRQKSPVYQPRGLRAAQHCSHIANQPPLPPCQVLTLQYAAQYSAKQRRRKGLEHQVHAAAVLQFPKVSKVQILETVEVHPSRLREYASWRAHKVTSTRRPLIASRLLHQSVGLTGEYCCHWIPAAGVYSQDQKILPPTLSRCEF